MAGYGRLAVPEADALAALVAALPGAASAADVSAVVEHAREQGVRCHISELVMLRALVGVLSGQLYAPVPAAA